MTRRSSADWQTLVEKQITSGLSVTQFCDKHQLSAQYFYARKSIINKSEPTTFIKAQVVTKQTTVIASQVDQSITLNTRVGELTFPHGTSATFIVQLMNGLSA